MIQSAQSLNESGQTTRGAAFDAARIPTLGHDDAIAMATVELDRFLTLIETLGPDEWSKPTACTLWDVRQTVAHVSASAAAYAQWSEFTWQGSRKRQRPYRQAGMDQLDALNQIGVDDRADRAPAELISELREMGPRAILTRRRLPALVRAVRLPLGLAFPFDRIWISIGYLTDLILTRDVWIHRLDICRATDRPMVLDADHDARITALVMRDLNRIAAPHVGARTVLWELAGPAGGSWRIGHGGTPDATIRMDALDFHFLAAGRTSAADARPLAVVEGDEVFVRAMLERTSVPY